MLSITGHYHVVLDRHVLASTRARFFRAHHDLSNMEKTSSPKFVDLKKQGSFSFIELGDAVLMQILDASIFQKIDLFVMVHWGCEHDPEGSYGAYFSYKYDINANMLDICDIGPIAVLYAMQIITNNFNENNIKNALLLNVDNANFPTVKEKFINKPSKNCAQALLFSSEEQQYIGQISNVCVVRDKEMKDYATPSNKYRINIHSTSEHFNCGTILLPAINSEAPKTKVNIFDRVHHMQGSYQFSRAA